MGASPAAEPCALRALRRLPCGLPRAKGRGILLPFRADPKEGGAKRKGAGYPAAERFCDLCQNCCPVTRQAAERGTLFTQIEYFRVNRIERLDRALIEQMNDEEFASRAFSWRGKQTVLRNLDLLYPEEKGE